MSQTNVEVVFTKKQKSLDFQEIWNQLEPGEFFEMGFEPGDSGLYVKVGEYNYLAIYGMRKGDFYGNQMCPFKAHTVCFMVPVDVQITVK